MNILGLNIFHADSSACLIVDGKIIAASEEERHNRIKHFIGFPTNSIRYCLNYANLDMKNIDLVTINFNPFYNIKNKILFALKKPNFGLFNRYQRYVDRYNLKKLFKENLDTEISSKILRVPHHLSHISSSYLISGFKECIGYSSDGAGDFSTTERYILNKNKFKLISKNIFPHSIGILYQAFTQFLGFREYGDEYKVMGMSAYGSPDYEKQIYELFDFSKEKGLNLKLKYFKHQNYNIQIFNNNAYPFYLDIFSEEIENLFGNPRKSNSELSSKHFNLACSIQKVFEDLILNDLNHLQSKYNYENLCYTGGCAFNSLLNGKILKKTKFKKLFIGPNPGDAGGAVGSALYGSLKFDKKFVNLNFNNAYLGPSYTNQYIKEKLEIINNRSKLFNFEFIENYQELIKKTSEYIEKFSIIGWFQDRAEWGPRALGNRSILADPRKDNIKDIINEKIKKRENFRPFAPIVMKDEAFKFFEMDQNKDIPYMNEVLLAKPITKKLYPGIVHADGTSRVQTVDTVNNKKIYDLLDYLKKEKNLSMLLNTSLNISEPICNNPIDALEMFSKSNLDILVLQNYIIKKINI